MVRIVFQFFSLQFISWGYDDHHLSVCKLDVLCMLSYGKEAIRILIGSWAVWISGRYGLLLMTHTRVEPDVRSKEYICTVLLSF